jgi:hypothetical protein
MHESADRLDLYVEENAMAPTERGIESPVPQPEEACRGSVTMMIRSVCRSRSISRRVWLAFCGLAILLLFSSVYLALDGYSVQTTVFLTVDPSLNARERSKILEREVHLLEGKELRRAVAKGLGRSFVGNWSAGLRHLLAWPERPATFGDPASPQSCAVPQVSVAPIVSGSGASVRLTMKGKDPEALKTALSEYVRQYVAYQRPAGPTADPSSRTNDAGKAACPYPADAIRQITSRMGKIRLSENQCELALGLLDSTKGTFRGFIPACDAAGMPALKKFQDRIVELEIKSREMAVQFTSRSTELKSLELRIEGVRNAMKDYIMAQLQFLRRDRENLLAQQAELMHNQCSQRRPGVPAKWSVPHEGPNGTFSVTRNLQVRAEEPAVVRAPFLANLEKIEAALGKAVGREISG